MLLVSSSTLHAQVRINEFLIDPLPQRVELINIGSLSADISGWYIDDFGGNSFFTIPQIDPLPPNSCSVFESDFNFNKTTSDSIRLFDKTAQPTSISANLIDSFSYRASSGSGITFKKLPDGIGNWATGEADFGFFNKSMNSCIAPPVPTPTPSSIPIPTNMPSATPSQQIENVYINEAMVNPDTGDSEWVELYNANEFSIELEDWLIDDNENGSNPKLFSSVILPKNYSVLEFASSLFNNSGDSVRLLDESENEKDSLVYSSSQKGKSWGLNEIGGAFCLQEPTKGFPNGSCLPTVQKQSSSKPKSSPSPRLVKPTLKVILNSSGKTIYPSEILTKKARLTTLAKKASNPTVSQGEILGEQVYIATDLQNSARSGTLPFISLSYSILTMISIFLKMKMSI